jgi:predicted nuclease of predicted toxin-antitoxin system
MINILLDENLPFDLIRLFEQFGFAVYHIKKLEKTG